VAEAVTGELLPEPTFPNTGLLLGKEAPPLLGAAEPNGEMDGRLGAPPNAEVVAPPNALGGAKAGARVAEAVNGFEVVAVVCGLPKVKAGFGAEVPGLPKAED